MVFQAIIPILKLLLEMAKVEIICVRSAPVKAFNSYRPAVDRAFGCAVSAWRRHYQRNHLGLRPQGSITRGSTVVQRFFPSRLIAAGLFHRITLRHQVLHQVRKGPVDRMFRHHRIDRLRQIAGLEDLEQQIDALVGDVVE